jgi:hypothetical protein
MDAPVRGGVGGARRGAEGHQNEDGGQLVLVTGNRNDDGPDSLEAVIRNENQLDSLPVITIADPDRMLRDRLYADTVAERLLDYLMRIDEIRSTGRIYVP